MGKMLKHFAISREVAPEHRLAIILVSAPQNVMVRPRDHLDRIELNKAKRLDQFIQIKLSCRGCRESLPREPETSRITVR